MGLAGAIFGAQTAGNVLEAHQKASLLRASAKMDKVEALIIRNAAANEEAADRKRTSKIISKARLVAGASGLDPNSGSPVIQILDKIADAELSAIDIRQRGEKASEAKLREGKMKRLQVPGVWLQAAQKTTSALGAMVAPKGAPAPKP